MKKKVTTKTKIDKTTEICKEVILGQAAEENLSAFSDEQLKTLLKNIDNEKLRRKNLKIVEENLKIEEQHSILLERVDSLLNFATEHSGGCDLTKDREDYNNLSFNAWNTDPYDSQYEKDSQYIQDYSYMFYAKCTRCALLALKETKYNTSFVADIKILLKEVKPLNFGL
jgi:hypothetical protein